MAVGRSDIYEVKDAPEDDSQRHRRRSSTLLDSSFGWNASMPAVQPPSPTWESGRATTEAPRCCGPRALCRLRRRGVPFRGTCEAGPKFAKMLVGAVGLDVYRACPGLLSRMSGEDVAELYPSSLSRPHRHPPGTGYADGLFVLGAISRGRR